MHLQDDSGLDLNAFRDRFGDVPQKGELTLLCPLKEDPTEKVRSCVSCSSCNHSVGVAAVSGPLQLSAGGAVQPAHRAGGWLLICFALPGSSIHAGRTLPWVPYAVHGRFSMPMTCSRCSALFNHVQIFVFFPDAAKVGVKDIKVRLVEFTVAIAAGGSQLQPQQLHEASSQANCQKGAWLFGALQMLLDSTWTVESAASRTGRA